MKKRILIVGGVAGGATAAARVRRLAADAEVIMFERGPHVSFSNCSLPYYLSGTVSDSEKLVMMSPEKFKKSYDIEARVNSEVLSINRGEKTIQVKNLISGETYTEAYDKLVLSPGASPVRPRSIVGVDKPHVFTVRNVKDIEALKAYIDENTLQEVCVIGGGFIGIEVAENLNIAGKRVSIVEATNQILAPFDYDMVQILHKEIINHGINLHVEDAVTEITDQEVRLASGTAISAQVVVLAIGVAPETKLAQDAGLRIGQTRCIWVDHNYRTSDPDIYAIGDAIEVVHAITGKPTRLSMAGPALRQARNAADDIFGISNRVNGVIGSFAVRLFKMNAAATGMTTKAAEAAGIPADFVYLISNDKVGIMPDVHPIHFKLVFEVPTGRVLGAQAIGMGEVAKRIDVVATLIRMHGTLEDLKDLELCYSPIYSTARDVTNLSALVATNILYGRFRQVPVSSVRELVESGAAIIDVREENEYAAGHLKTAVNIPLSQLRSRMDEIPRDRPVYLHCRSSQRSYNAICALQGNGFNNLYNISGSFLGISLFEYYNDIRLKREPIVTAYNFK